MVPTVEEHDHERVALVAVVGGAALLTSSWLVVATLDDVPALEARIFVALNGLSDALAPLVWPPVQVGSFAGSLAATTAIAVLTRRRDVAAGALVASQGAYWAAKAVKHLASRERPLQLLPVVRVRERASGLGYVSGHSAVAFALAVSLAPELRRGWRTAPFALASVVGFGRMYAGVHLPLDVVGGVGLGILAGLAGRRVVGMAR
jgi:undecaprenyl-diphosphatase